jgi:hypothetical protein
MLKWADVDSVKVTKRDESVRPARIELEIALKNGRRAPAELARVGQMVLVGKSDLGEYSISLDKVRAITPVK